jgi:purine nucleosidase
MDRMKTKQMSIALAALALYCAAEINAQPAPGADRPARQLVILDTDVGDDIDDAFAIALLLNSPEVELLGVTTTYGDTELRARLVDRYLAAVQRNEIPIAAGLATPATNHFTQTAYARQAPERHHEDAVGFLLQQIKAHPGEITLIAIGPLFNEQSAIARDRVTFRKLQRVVIMGGSVYRGYDQGTSGSSSQPPSAEWNIRCDPAGAQALLASGVPVFMMPLDSTQIHLTPHELGALLAHGSPLTDQLALLYHQWTGADTWRMPTLYDPVAASFAIRPELCPVQPMHLDVDAAGFTRLGTGEPNAHVCLRADEDGFRAFLLQRILGEAGK